ncbi:MAG: DUF465 domain-containing protein [Nitrospirota bacterium]
MMSADKEIYEVLREKNREFRELEREHRLIEEKLNKLSKKNILLSSEELLIHQLKKEKLQKKDKMTEIMKSFINLNNSKHDNG